MNLLRGHSRAILLFSAVGMPLPHAGAHPSVDLLHAWHLVGGHHWQVDAEEPAETAAETDDREQTRGGCEEGMVAVAGDMKQGGLSSIEGLQNATCTHWIDEKYPERCATFDRASWERVSAPLSTVPMHFCIDRFEYPNRRHAFPIIDVTWTESEALCAGAGKRLCNETEWTFACEGEEATPYPTGYGRDAAACVIDRPWRAFDEALLSPREGRTALVTIDQLWQGEPSGAHASCRSVAGVYDLTGNVDEWTSSARRDERPSILKGGYWGPDRARCRPSTRAHGEAFSYYQQGFRCCRDLE